MRRDTLLVLLTVAGSALSWWPLIIEPSLDLPWWLPLAIVPLCAGLSTILSGGLWLRFVVASVVGTFAGLCSGYAIWPPSDPIAASYTLFAIGAALGAAVLVSLAACLVGAAISVSEKYKRVLWLLLASGVAYGPIALALTPPLVAHRVARNDRIAAERFSSLKGAVEQTIAESGNLASICNPAALRRHYSGPPFREKTWNYIAGNYVTEDGYAVGIWVYCPSPDGYMIDAIPARGKADGTRRFCTDESKKVGCGMDWDQSRKRSVCTPCAQ